MVTKRVAVVCGNPLILKGLFFMTVWTLRKSRIDVRKMSEDLNISPILAQILGNRNIFSRDDADLYIKPRISLMGNTFLMKDIEKAIKIVIRARDLGKKIFIYGDYDVDGITSTVILYKALKQFGCSVEYYIPNRRYEGYGLNKNCITAMKERGCDVVFTCDNGITAIDEALYIKELGMEFIVLDHHEPIFSEGGEDILPNADAVIDCKRKECAYPFKALCAGGMAYKFVKALFEFSKTELKGDAELFVFAAIATVCDIVDLRDENRIIVRNGLRILNSGRRMNFGIKALLECQGLKKKITEETLGFIIGPCINASGRIESAIWAVELFLEEDYEKALEKARELIKINEERKRITSEGYESVIHNIENSDIKYDKVMVVYDENVDESVMGIVAGRIKEHYYRPVIVISKGEEFDKGSGRSIEGYNIFENLSANKELFVKFGGHKMAAGLSIERKNIDILRKRLNENCSLTEKELTEVIRIDKAISLSEITLELACELEIMRPFGQENTQALFATKNVIVKNIRYVGVNGNIIQFVFSDEDGNEVRGISFKGFEKFKKYVEYNFDDDLKEEILSGFIKNAVLCLDIVYTIEINEYNDNKNVQLILKDFRKSAV